VHFRGTAAHNTVCVDGLQQTRYEPRAIKDASRHASGSVRHKITGPAPRATLLSCMQAGDFALLHGRAESHEYDAVHERVIVRLGGLWIVSDTLRAPTDHDYTLRFQLGPQAQGRCSLVDDDPWRIDSPGLVLLQPLRAGQQTLLGAGWVSPSYGVKHAAPAVVTQARGRDIDFDTVLLPFAGEAPVASLRKLATHTPDLPPPLRIEHGSGRTRRIETWLQARGIDTRTWHVEGFAFTGRWLLMRHDGDGRLLQAVTHAGGRLSLDGHEIATTVATEARA
jgi:hypothetical protein